MFGTGEAVMIELLGGVYTTDSGMLCLWDPNAFTRIVSHETWEKELCDDEDILRHIKAGAFVPVGIHRGSDGAFAVHLRVGDANDPVALTERETKYILAESEPYLLKCSGRICLSGLEHVAGQPGRQVACVPVHDGSYAVQIYLIAWDDEPGMKDSNGRPKPGSLPDFVVLTNPATDASAVYRQKVHALDRRK
jgi:hypothetical protein